MAEKKVKLTRKQRKKSKGFFLKLFDVFLNLSFVAFVAGLGFAFHLFNQLPDLQLDSMIMPNDSFVFDMNNNFIGTISRKEENQENINKNEMNQSVINMLLGTEDATFFQHFGVDIVNTTEAAVNEVIFRREDTGGGSSITQQIVGRTHLDRNERSITRKAKEIMLSVKTERELDKETILELYLNYFGFGRQNIHGIQRASEYFFSQNAYELNAVQAAILVGTLNAPSNFNPLGSNANPDLGRPAINNSQGRLRQVLQANRRQGYLNDQEYFLLNQVRVENTVKINHSATKTQQNNQFLDLVKREMEEVYGVDFNANSYRIYTTMDPKAQGLANKILHQKTLPLPHPDMDFGFIVTRTNTGEITAVGGGKHYRSGQIQLLNNAVDLQNQPGSAFKPIIDYAPAFEFLRWSDRQTISNEPLNYPGTNTPIRNFDGQSGGHLTLDKALVSSRNLTAVRAFIYVTRQVGFSGLNNFLTRLGFNFADNEITYAYSIGGTTTGVSPKQMAAAYAAFGNGGYYIRPFTVRKFVNQYDETVTEAVVHKERAMDERTAFLMANALERSTRDNSYGLLSATGGIPGTHWAGKTGTSNWGKEGRQFGIPNLSPKDSWMAGFTSEYTMAVWSGFTPRGIRRGHFPSWGPQHDYASRIFGEMMRTISTGNERTFMRNSAPRGLVRSTNGGWRFEGVPEQVINIPRPAGNNNNNNNNSNNNSNASNTSNNNPTD